VQVPVHPLEFGVDGVFPDDLVDPGDGGEPRIPTLPARVCVRIASPAR
jgi:hypothetical protein